MKMIRKPFAFISRDRNIAKSEAGEKCGYANGYVVIPPEHPLYELSLDFQWDCKALDNFRELTYADRFSNCQGWKTIDFLNPPLIEPWDMEDWWVFGFDTMNHGCDLDTWPKDVVIHYAKMLCEIMENFE